MNVYVRELVSSLAQAGVECTTYTRADRAGLPAEVLVEPGHRVVHIEAGPHHLPKEALADVARPVHRRRARRTSPADGGADVVHANYWLSGVVGHRLKHDLDVPFVSTFHTLARVKAEGGDPEPLWRDRAEAEIIGCADAICVSCAEEEQPVPPPVRRPAGPDRDRRPWRRARLLRAGRRTRARRARSGCPPTCRCCCSSAASSR